MNKLINAYTFLKIFVIYKQIRNILHYIEPSKKTNFVNYFPLLLVRHTIKNQTKVIEQKLEILKCIFHT